MHTELQKLITDTIEATQVQYVAEKTAQYMALYLKQRIKRDSLSKQTKLYLEGYARRIGLELPKGLTVHSVSKQNLVRHIVDFEINLIDVEDELTRLSVNFDDFHLLLPEIE